MSKNKTLNPKDSKINQGEISSIQKNITHQVWSSPFPPPEVIEKYKNIDTNVSNELINQIIAESHHRRKCEEHELKIYENQVVEQIKIAHKQANESILTRVLAFILCIFLFAMTFFLILQGHSLESIITLVGTFAFIYWGKIQKNDSK